MCGRYTLRRGQLARAVFEALRAPSFEEFSEGPRFNIAPSQRLPIVRVNSKGERVIDAAEWGLVPHWAKATPKVRPINARAETVPTSGMFREALERRRCMVPADGFYEWKARGKGPKQPYFFHMKDDGLFAFGGLYERWRGPADGEEPLETFTIITTPPNPVVSPVHDRMPLIVHRQDYARWLDPNAGAKNVADLLRPYPPDEMEAFPVSPRVNAPKNDGPDCIESLTEGDDEPKDTLF